MRQTHICEVDDRTDDPEEKHETGKDVDLRPPWDDEWIGNPSDLIPIESQCSHAKTEIRPEERVDSPVPGCDPAGPIEPGESDKQESYIVQPLSVCTERRDPTYPATRCTPWNLRWHNTGI